MSCRLGELATAALAVILGIALPGCQAGWVLKQAKGQIALLGQRRSLEDPELSESLGPEASARLAWVPRVLEFARGELGLEPGDAYTTVLDTGGKPVSTVVLAAHPLALAPYLWCFPIVGCVPYKGFFDGEDARAEAFRLRNEGWDVVVLPVEAYSSLGWFSDPIVSTLLERPLPELVETLIHETVHRTLFYPGETTLNESLASFIARQGAASFLERHPDAATPEEVDAFRAGLAAAEEDTIVLERTRRDLDALYRSPLARDRMRHRKHEILRTAARARASLFGPSVPLPASNAFLLSFADYNVMIPALARLQESAGGTPRDLMTYLTQVRNETGGPPPELTTTP